MLMRILGHSRLSSLSCISNRGRGNLDLSTIARGKKVSKLEESRNIKNVLIAVDPDTHGAIACCTWMSPADHENEAIVDLSNVTVKIFDMPCATVQLVKKMKTTGKQAVRRTIDIQAARSLVMQSISSNSGCSVRLQAYIESPPIIPTDSALSTASSSYTHGVWQGLLSMSGFTAGSVPARIWKKDFGLWRTEKDASRHLAMKIFPQMQDLLNLKKHHGRAEALLIAAWGLGICVEKETSELSHGPMRSCKVTDAYGNMVIFSAEGLVEDTALMHETSKMIYADAQLLLDMKVDSKREKQEKKAELAEKRKLSRKIVKAALANCKNDG